jgi:tRNA pseudouridine38-40 synthase
MPRYALRLGYDGSAFAGCWRQGDRRTVLGAMDAALMALGETPDDWQPAARTDAGVHARGQVLAGNLTRDWDPARLASVLDARVDHDLSILAAARVADDFQAAQAQDKTYRYTLDLRPRRDPLAEQRCWRPPAGVDAAALSALWQRLPGGWDLSPLRRRGDQRSDSRCQILQTAVIPDARGLVLELTVNRMIQYGIRSLVGTAVAEARGDLPHGSLLAALSGQPPHPGLSSHQAPAQGLVLEQIRYAQEPAWVSPGTP